MTNTAWAQRLLPRVISAVPALSIPVYKISFAYLIPFNHTIGMTLEAIEPDGTVSLRLAARGSNRNAAGTVHGAAIMALAESVHGAALSYGLREKHAGCRIFTKRPQIAFLKKVTSELRVSCRIDAHVLADISTRLDQTGKSQASLTSTVRDTNDNAVATLEASYHISWQATNMAAPQPSEVAGQPS